MDTDTLVLKRMRRKGGVGIKSTCWNARGYSRTTEGGNRINIHHVDLVEISRSSSIDGANHIN